MKKILLAVALLTVSSVAQAQKLSGDMLLSTDRKLENFAVSAVSSPLVSFELAKLKLDGVVLPSVLFDKNFKNWTPTIGMGALVGVDKVKFAYSTFKMGSTWNNFIGLQVKF